MKFAPGECVKVIPWKELRGKYPCDLDENGTEYIVYDGDIRLYRDEIEPFEDEALFVSYYDSDGEVLFSDETYDRVANLANMFFVDQFLVPFDSDLEPSLEIDVDSLLAVLSS